MKQHSSYILRRPLSRRGTRPLINKLFAGLEYKSQSKKGETRSFQIFLDKDYCRSADLSEHPDSLIKDGKKLFSYIVSVTPFDLQFSDDDNETPNSYLLINTRYSGVLKAVHNYIVKYSFKHTAHSFLRLDLELALALMSKGEKFGLAMRCLKVGALTQGERDSALSRIVFSGTNVPMSKGYKANKAFRKGKDSSELEKIHISTEYFSIEITNEEKKEVVKFTADVYGNLKISDAEVMNNFESLVGSIVKIADYGIVIPTTFCPVSRTLPQ